MHIYNAKSFEAEHPAQGSLVKAFSSRPHHECPNIFPGRSSPNIPRHGRAPRYADNGRRKQSLQSPAASAGNRALHYALTLGWEWYTGAQPADEEI